MSTKDTNLKTLLSPARSGTYFAPFRSRSANPDGFNSKMKYWIGAIEEWSLINKKLIFSLIDIHDEFVSSDMKLRPNKECIRLVLSEMKRKSKIIPLSCLKSSSLWSPQTSSSIVESFIDPNGWVGWGMNKLVITPAMWALSTVKPAQDQLYSDLTDMSITDNMEFICQKALDDISSNLKAELTRVAKAEKRTCFEWPHLVELLEPILNNIIDAPGRKQLLHRLEIIIEYLALKKFISLTQDADVKVVKIASNEDYNDDVSITKKDIANARLMRARELLTNEADRLHSKMIEAKNLAIDHYRKQNIVKAKSCLRNAKRLAACVETREAQLSNVEHLIDQLESTESNMQILQAYKDGAEALKIANTKFDDMSVVMDEVHDVTAETNYLQQTFNEMINDIVIVTQPDISIRDLEKELEVYSDKAQDTNKDINETLTKQDEAAPSNQNANSSTDSIIARLDSIKIDRELPSELNQQHSTPMKSPLKLPS